MVVCLKQVADLHIAQLMPLPLTVSCFIKIQIGFTFLVPAHLGSPGKRAVKRVCVCLTIFSTLSFAISRRRWNAAVSRRLTARRRVTVRLCSVSRGPDAGSCPTVIPAARSPSGRWCCGQSVAERTRHPAEGNDRRTLSPAPTNRPLKLSKFQNPRWPAAAIF